MPENSNALLEALRMLVGLDAELYAIIGLSLRISLTAVMISGVIGFPIGAFLAMSRFPGRGPLIVIFNAFMGLPPVVVGLTAYLLLSRSGPLGVLGLLFTPTAMVIAQTILITPIIIALSRQVVADLWDEYRDQLTSFNVGRLSRIGTLLWEGRYSLMTTLLAGFGRAIAEVGAVMIVGGNIAGQTRVMTTAIALETSKGNLVMAMALGIILIIIALGVNAAATMVNLSARRTAF